LLLSRRTNRSRTGGWEREEYNTQRRECEDWRAAAKAAQGTAAMLKKILEELEE